MLSKCLGNKYNRFYTINFAIDKREGQRGQGYTSLQEGNAGLVQGGGGGSFLQETGEAASVLVGMGGHRRPWLLPRPDLESGEQGHWATRWGREGRKTGKAQEGKERGRTHLPGGGVKVGQHATVEWLAMAISNMTQPAELTVQPINYHTAELELPYVYNSNTIYASTRRACMHWPTIDQHARQVTKMQQVHNDRPLSIHLGRQACPATAGPCHVDACEEQIIPIYYYITITRSLPAAAAGYRVRLVGLLHLLLLLQKLKANQIKGFKGSKYFVQKQLSP
ncbi:uncharacterized protein LOC112875119 isoform X2 [Panicum hallii]|uniref:uncharacterized protein LOC112875119 isoform X2 n=1 Tax=Panicum hallii TaxID=206008 RepID=UPI000DF4CEA1|nr:uncharacterized protein LOC112875119 isoform X2 [Panicum hallii]